MENVNIQPEEIAKSIHENLKVLRDFKDEYKNLSDEEKERLKAQYEEIKELALAIKKDLKSDSL